MDTHNTTFRDLAAGIAAGVAALIAGYAAGEGLGTVEYLTALLSFLTVTFGLQTIQARKELRAVRAERASLYADVRNEIQQVRSLRFDLTDKMNKSQSNERMMREIQRLQDSTKVGLLETQSMLDQVHDRVLQLETYVSSMDAQANQPKHEDDE